MLLRRFYPYILGLMGVLLSFSACNSNSKIKVPADIEDALYDKYKYSDISALEWSLVDEFFVGEFRMDGVFHCKAWFNAEADWYMTETADIIYEDLPKEIIKSFGSGDNGKAREAYKVDFAHVETRYIIETKSSFFFYRENGVQFKRVDGAWQNRPIVIDGEMLRYIKNNCDSVTSIIDADMKATPLRVNISEGKPSATRYKTIYFDTPVMWHATVWEIRADEVPDGVKKVIAEDAWQAAYRVKYPEVGLVCGFKLKTGENVFFNDNGDPVEIDDVILD